MVIHSPAINKPSGYRTRTVKPRLLIVSDSARRSVRLKGALSVDGVEIECIGSLRLSALFCARGYEVVMIDVSPAKLASVVD